EGDDTITSYDRKAVTVLEGRRERAAVAPSGPQGLSRRRIPSSASSAPRPPPPTTLDPEDHPFWQQNWFLFLLLLMAFSFFAVAVFLYLGLEVPEGSPAPANAAQEGVQVGGSYPKPYIITYGSVIKLMHERTKFRLHSHDVPYGSGSGQQSVTGFPNVDDSNSYWIVKSSPDSSAKQGDAIPNGTIIRLQHMRTRKWLHSHLHASPITGNLEVSIIYYVSCFGGDGKSDTGDFWRLELPQSYKTSHMQLISLHLLPSPSPFRLEIEGSGKTWKQDQRVRLLHVDTGGYLHSHDKKYSRIAGGQQEVCGVREKRPDNVWLAAEGVYLPINASK
ncbi:hypothetical protein GW17_00028787, partial [Ensete ventricosum]